MDVSAITTIVLFVTSILLAMNAFFIKGLVKKIETSDRQSVIVLTKMEGLAEKVDTSSRNFATLAADLSNMKSDVGVLRFAILKELEKRR